MGIFTLTCFLLAQLPLARRSPDSNLRTEKGVFDIREFGAVGDGEKVNTQSVQMAIDACAASGGGEVLVTGGRFVIGTIYLKDNVTLCLAESGTLLGSVNIQDYATDTHKNAYANEPHMDRCLIFARGAENISIVGPGKIDGQGHEEHFPNGGPGHRPMLLRFMQCKHLRMRDVTLANPAAWTSAWLYCEDITIDGVRIHSRANWNGDGLDFDGCRDVRVSNCSFDTSDDSICLQASRADQPCQDIVINNCVFVSQWAGVRIGLLSVGDLQNVALSNCTFRDIGDAGIKIQMCEGGSMRNMVFSNLVMQNVPRPVFMTLNRWRMGVDTPEDTPPIKFMGQMHFSDIWVDNSEWVNEPCGIVLSGVPGHCIEDISFQDVSLKLPGGGTTEEAEIEELPTFQDQRPEFFVLGNRIPFAGFYARHVRHLRLSNFRIEAVSQEMRPAILCEDVENVTLHFTQIGRAFTGSETIHFRRVSEGRVVEP